MEKATKFFFLSGVNENVKCNFFRFDDQVHLNFCHIDDQVCRDRLNISIRSEMALDGTTLKDVKKHFVSYELTTDTGVIKQAESLPIRDPAMVWGIVISIVNDVFPVDIS